MLILSLESSAKAASAALCQGDIPLAQSFINTKLTHSETLLALADQTLQNTGRDISEVELFCVANGPGSFTGVRIGVSLLKGLAHGRGPVCAGVSTLLALAHNISGFEGIYCPVMDARNKQVYNALFSYEEGRVKRLCQDRAVSLSDLRTELLAIHKPVWLLGDGAQLASEVMEGLPNVRLVNGSVRLQNAISVAAAGFEVYKNSGGTDALYLDVMYLRPSQAEREYSEKHRGE